jgi:hypothetical protein
MMKINGPNIESFSFEHAFDRWVEKKQRKICSLKKVQDSLPVP